jgi:tetratricopeptide (TPR) repeat protein
MVLLSFWLYYELQGNRLFKEGKFELAKAKYEKVLREFNHVNPQDEDEGKIFGDTRNMLHLNVAACLLKMGEWRKSIETCNKVAFNKQFS